MTPKDFKITRRSVDALGPEHGSVKGEQLADSEMKGFLLIVYASGEKSFAVRYRANGIRHLLKIGSYPAMKVETARVEAARILSDASRGVDEAATRQAARAAAEATSKRVTFATWRGQYVMASSRLKSIAEVERYCTLTGLSWDRKPLADISSKDVEALRNELAKRGTTTANRWHATLAAAFASAVRLGYIEKNPFANVKRFPENPPRQRVMTPDEEKRLRRAIASWTNKWERCAFTLLVDTAARLSEVLKARWTDFDLDEKGAGTWRIPSPKAGKPQAIPILPHVGKIVLATPRLTDCEFLVPGRNVLVRRHDLRRPKKALLAAAEIPSDLWVHDLRRSAGLRITKSMGLTAAKMLLRHSSVRVTESVYAPLSAVDVRGYAEGAEKARVKTAAKVIAFRRKKTA